MEKKYKDANDPSMEAALPDLQSKLLLASVAEKLSPDQVVLLDSVV